MVVNCACSGCKESLTVIAVASIESTAGTLKAQIESAIMSILMVLIECLYHGSFHISGRHIESLNGLIKPLCY